MLLPDQIEYITRDDSRFPPMLLEISDPPKGLYVRGNLKDHPCISVVGTRRCTPYGKRATFDIVQGVVSSGMGIVSGMAFGIDVEAHKATLDCGGYTVAVLATGIDDATLYPREHVAIARRILESGGAIISEQPPRSPSFKYAFPKRNRLIAGMTPATLVVEASTDSGSLITARLALEENREVMAVPGSIYSSVSDGCHTLLKLGAKLVRNADDVLKTIAFDRPELMAESRASLPMTEVECRVYAILDSPMHIDDLAEKLELSAAAISATLTLLDMKGYVVHQAGQIWLKKAVFAKNRIK